MRDLSTAGEKGDLSFGYRCLSPRDAACTDDRASPSLREPRAFPAAVAVGASFGLTAFDVDGLDARRVRLTPASRELARPLPEEGEHVFLAEAPGEVGFTALRLGDSRVVDLFHLRLVAPSFVAITCEDADPRTGAPSPVAAGAAVRCGLVPRASSGKVLAGALRGRWWTTTPDVLRLHGPGGTTLGEAAAEEITVEGRAPGLGEVTVESGGRTVSLALEVTP